MRHRIADLGSDGLQLGDEPGRERARRTCRRGRPSRSRRGRRRRGVPWSTASTDVSDTRITKSMALSISTMTSCTRPPPMGADPPLAMLSRPADTAARRSPELRSRPSESAMSRPSDDTTVASLHTGHALDEVRDQPVEVARLRAQLLDHLPSSWCHRDAPGRRGGGEPVVGLARRACPRRLPCAWRVSNSCTR